MTKDETARKIFSDVARKASHGVPGKTASLRVQGGSRNSQLPLPQDRTQEILEYIRQNFRRKATNSAAIAKELYQYGEVAVRKRCYSMKEGGMIIFDPPKDGRRKLKGKPALGKNVRITVP